jgi:hypothetical protein
VEQLRKLVPDDFDPEDLDPEDLDTVDSQETAAESEPPSVSPEQPPEDEVTRTQGAQQ